ncbi:hypothetical protein GGQ05_001363 [Salinibacter ruber]|nr:hypothetical protein [Salinibacter ruber]
MDLPDVNASGFGAFRLLVFFDLVLATKLILIAVPSNLDSFRLAIRGPVDQHWVVPTPV